MKDTSGIIKNHPELSAEDWRQHVENWQSSSLTQTKYCKRNNLSFHSFTYQRAKLMLRRKKKATKEVAQFAEVKVMEQEPKEAEQSCSAQGAFVIDLPSGIKLTTPFNLSTQQLVELLNELRTNR